MNKLCRKIHGCCKAIHNFHWMKTNIHIHQHFEITAINDFCQNECDIWPRKESIHFYVFHSLQDKAQDDNCTSGPSPYNHSTVSIEFLQAFPLLPASYSI